MIMERPIRPVEVFYSYAYEDESLQKELDKHLAILKQQGFITTWHSREAKAGTEWKREIDEHLNSADIILLLLSADFMASNFCYGVEMKHALERHFKGDTRVIPIILRPFLQRGAPRELRELQVLPYSGKAITSWTNQDEAFQEIAEGIQEIITTIQSTRKYYDAEYANRSFKSTAPPLYNLVLDREIAELQINRANTYYARQNYEEALAIYEQALHLYSNATSAYIGKGNALQKLQRYAEALVAYQQALETTFLSSDEAVVAHRGKGDVLYELLRWGEALDAYEQALLLDPNDSAAYRGKCDAFQELQRDKEAFDAYEQAQYQASEEKAQAQRQAREKELAERQAHQEELARWHLLPPAICTLGHENPAGSAFCDECGEPLP